MSFREKSAWISLVSILLVGGIYLLHVPWTLKPSTDPGLLRALLYCIIAFLIIEIISHVVVAFRAPQDARAPKDERERLIELKATYTAAHVYVIGSFAAVLTLHHGANSIAIGNGVLLAFLIAEVVNYALRIVYHRRGF